MLGFSRLSQITSASAGVGLSVRGLFGRLCHPCLFHFEIVWRLIGRPAAANLAATLSPVGRSRVFQSAMASAGLGLLLVRARRARRVIPGFALRIERALGRR